MGWVTTVKHSNTGSPDYRQSFAVKGIKSRKTLKPSQLCAGRVIEEPATKPKVYEYVPVTEISKSGQDIKTYDFKEVTSVEYTSRFSNKVVQTDVNKCYYNINILDNSRFELHHWRGRHMSGRLWRSPLHQWKYYQ